MHEVLRTDSSVDADHRHAEHGQRRAQRHGEHRGGDEEHRGDAVGRHREANELLPERQPALAAMMLQRVPDLMGGDRHGGEAGAPSKLAFDRRTVRLSGS